MRAALLLLCLACTADKEGGDSLRPSAEDSGGGDGGDSGAGGDGGSGGPDPDRYFPDEAVWYQDISGAAVDPGSEAAIAFLQAHGWGLGRFQIDSSIEVLSAGPDTPLRDFEPTEDFYSPDCDQVPVPVPEDGALEGESGLACESDGDCHLIVEDRDHLQLYEMWRADIRGEDFQGGCLAVWQMDRVYGPEGRGEQCTSADAAGYPIAALLFSADEVAAGEIRHAIRFILPNTAIRAGEYVHPATHSTGAASAPPEAPPYGAHLRLRADYPLEDLPNEASRTVARALQTYGMFLADGGNVALTARSDRSTAAKWSELMESRDLEDIQPADFELLEMEEPIPLTYDCARVD